ncbi:MAG: hypothetical protein KDA92_09045 [Planctomycetales bacterium]|nr:hypothetical protein [Planctomycetales bacterium]MCA9166060.1 hypothetical protein [Planctomycetales bacterium]
MRRCGKVFGLLICMTSSIRSAEPILEYRFNDTGSSTVSTGSSTAELAFYDSLQEETDLHSVAGAGVAGDIVGHYEFGSDIAFDNSLAERMQGPGGIGLNEGDTSVSELNSWTVSGWYKTEEEEVPLSGGGTVLFMTPPRFGGEPGISNAGFAVRGENPNGLRTSVNGTNTQAGSSGVDEWLDSQTWVFFAVTYDGTSEADNLRYYQGYRNEQESSLGEYHASLVAVDSLPMGATLPSPGFSIGNRTDDYARAFDGYLDNLRVYGSKVDGAGALSLAELEQIRAGDLAVQGDLDYDGEFTHVDVDHLMGGVRQGATDLARYDLNRDHAVDAADITYWVHSLKHTYFGDANLDGQFDSEDFVTVFASGQYEDELVGNSTWSTGDWDGDGEFTTSDFVVAFADGGYEQGPRPAIVAVPEADQVLSMLVAWIMLIGTGRRLM